MFDIAKDRFAFLLKNLGNGQSRFAFNFRVEIDEMPGELRGQQTANGALARAHETGQADHAAFRDRPRQRACLMGMNPASDSECVSHASES